MANIYVWLDITAPGMPTSSSIMFIGKENECVEWVRNATYARDIRPKIRYELTHGFWFRRNFDVLNCKLTAGEGATRIERTFDIKIVKR